MNAPDLFLIGDLPGFTPQIGRLVSMMRYVRHTTLAEVEGLGVEQLDDLHDGRATRSARCSPTSLRWRPGTRPRRFSAATSTPRRWKCGAPPWISGNGRGERSEDTASLTTSTCWCGSARKTLHELAQRDDAWLEEETPFSQGRPANNYFKWFHVFEDELNHRGQIRWLRKRAESRT